MDLRAIADAIAARYVGVTVGGEGLQVGPTALIPNGIVKGPALLVLPPDGTRSVGLDRQRDDELDFTVLWLMDPQDMPTRTTAIYAWGQALYDKVLENYDLDLAYVKSATPVSFRTAFDEPFMTFGKYDVVETIVRVRIWETITTMAI